MYVLIWLLFWIVCNGRITEEILLLGIVICSGFYCFLCRYMGYDWKKDGKLLQKAPLFLKYGITLVWEMIIANLAVVRIILSPDLETEPTFRTFQMDFKTETARVALANSITLTPGTYTVSLEENVYTIHALDRSFAEGIEESVFVKQLKKLEE